jgi:hypothetical protein
LAKFADINNGKQLNKGKGGDISGLLGPSFILITLVFGETCVSISRKALELVVLFNKFPPGYRFPSERKCPDDNLPPALAEQIADGTPFDIGIALDAKVNKLDDIICPFLSTMIKQGAVENKKIYTRFELQKLTLEAGVPERDAEMHSEGNFLNIPTGLIDIFDMEGNPNEHQTSTGISDCPSPFPSLAGALDYCRLDKIVGQVKCFPTQKCLTPLRAKRAFEIFVKSADVLPKDGVITAGEFLALDKLYNISAFPKSPLAILGDINDGRQINLGEGGKVGGTLAGSFILITEVFGETCNAITIESLADVLLKSKFPSGYRFPSDRECPPGLPDPKNAFETLGEKKLSAGPKGNQFIINALSDGKIPNPLALGAAAAKTKTRDLDGIICPFFSTMIKNGALESKLVYTKLELEKFSEEAGIPRVDAEMHAEGNFLNIPTGLIDLFDMEGNPNEHRTSTGIADCPSPFPGEVGSLKLCKFDKIVGNTNVFQRHHVKLQKRHCGHSSSTSTRPTDSLRMASSLQKNSSKRKFTST